MAAETGVISRSPTPTLLAASFAFSVKDRKNKDKHDDPLTSNFSSPFVCSIKVNFQDLVTPHS